MSLKIVKCFDLPKQPDENTIYRLLPKDPDEKYYWERVDRNIGWITKEEQTILRNSVVGIAGNGGMGGLLSAVFIRTGIGETRITDREVFDTSNINRQFAGRRDTIGKSKVVETAKELRRVSDDTIVAVYPQGINETTVDDFVKGCDVILDEIEFFAVGARILLHERARKFGVPLINCNVVGFGSRLFYFTPSSMTMEELLGLTYNEARELENRARAGSRDARNEIIRRVMAGLVPEVPRYKSDDVEVLWQRLSEEGKGAIFATNPPLSTGFVADRVILHLLSQKSAISRDIVELPEMPGYLYLDAAKMEAKVVKGRWTQWTI